MTRAESVRLVVGLGNPGPEYAQTRHNVGFQCVELLAHRHGRRWQDDRRRTHSLICVADGLVLAKPQTYMNRSGLAVKALRERLRVDLSRLLVVYDDMDLPLGTLRLRERGSPGTHNGMRSVVAELGSQNFPRLRIGIGQAGPGQATPHVLGGFDPEEEPVVDALLARAAEAVLAWVNEGATIAMNRYNPAR